MYKNNKKKYYNYLAKIRNTEEYSIWRNAVFKRDKYTCQCCHGEKGSHVLQAHHLKSFARYPKLRFDVTNGITLCDKCHDSRVKGSFHDAYGVKGTTEKQLRKYIKDYNAKNPKKEEQKAFDVSHKNK
jgi:5-methylcytosine-specific restriction endonuclease McrA